MEAGKVSNSKTEVAFIVVMHRQKYGSDEIFHTGIWLQ